MLLRQVSRRVDTMLKNRKDQSDALLSLVKMLEFGVHPKHLPVLPSARALVRICSRGQVVSRAEQALVQSVLRNSDLVCHLGQNAEALGQALDAWQPQNRSAPKTLRPNPSLERTSAGKPLGPRAGSGHHPPRGPSAFPAGSAQLKR
jgi:hypothetical protein